MSTDQHSLDRHAGASEELREVFALAEAMHRLTHCRDADDVLDTVLDGLVSGLGFRSAALWTVAHWRARFVLYGSRGFDHALPRTLPIDGPGRDAAISAVHEHGRRVNYPADDQPCLQSYRDAGEEPASYALIPVQLPLRPRRRFRDRLPTNSAVPINGVLLVEPLSPFGDLLLSTFLKTAELIADRIFRNEYLEDISRRDGLTGLWNRREMQRRLCEAAWRARGGASLGMLFCDVDHFKQVNDTFGHDAGDRVLQMVGRTIDRTIGERDVVGRFGGEELLIMRPEADHDALRRTAESVREAVEALDLTGIADGLAITLSLGGAVFPHDARAPRKLLRVADEALYRAKRGGRNRVVLHGDA